MADTPPVIYLRAALGGALGALARWAITEALPHSPGDWPWSTLLENLLGCLAIGALLAVLLARFPHEYDTWLGWGHTVPNGDPPVPFADNTRLCCALLLQPLLMPPEFAELKVDDEKTVHFYSLVPLYPEEVDFKLRQGVEALVERFDAGEVTELLDVRRANVCKGRR